MYLRWSTHVVAFVKLITKLLFQSTESVLLQKDLILFIWILVIQSLSRVRFLMTPWNATRQVSLSFTISRSLLNSTPVSIFFFPLKWECTAIYWTLKTLLLQFFIRTRTLNNLKLLIEPSNETAVLDNTLTAALWDLKADDSAKLCLDFGPRKTMS